MKRRSAINVLQSLQLHLSVVPADDIALLKLEANSLQAYKILASVNIYKPDEGQSRKITSTKYNTRSSGAAAMPISICIVSHDILCFTINSLFIS